MRNIREDIKTAVSLFRWEIWSNGIKPNITNNIWHYVLSELPYRILQEETKLSVSDNVINEIKK